MCPPTTFYNEFPKNYNLICPELRQCQYPPQYQSDIHHFFDRKEDTWLWNTLAKPIPESQRVEKFQRRLKPGAKLSPLERLPIELIEEILDILLEDPWSDWGGQEEVVILGLASPVLWHIVLARIHRTYRAKVPSNWAGRKLGYHGPWSLFTDTEVENYGLQDAFFLGQRISHWNLKLVFGQPEVAWRQCVDYLRTTLDEVSSKEWDAIDQDLSEAYLFPRNRVWVLRNLTTSQFVRSDRLVPPGIIMHQGELPQERLVYRLQKKQLWDRLKLKSKEELPLPSCESLTLAQVFLVLTCSSTEHTTSPWERPFLIQQGPWVGCAFEIVTLEDHMADPSPQYPGYTEAPNDSEKQNPSIVWTDVSNVVAADVGHLRWCLQHCQGGKLLNRWKRNEDFWEVVITSRAERRAWAGQEYVGNVSKARQYISAAVCHFQKSKADSEPPNFSYC